MKEKRNSEASRSEAGAWQAADCPRRHLRQGQGPPDCHGKFVKPISSNSSHYL
jgi:hypothetical protein